MLKLNIHEEGDVTLPGEIANSTLTLAEIGAIVCFAALQAGAVTDAAFRFGSDEMKEATESIRAKGVMDVRVEGGALKIAIDLAPAFPADEDKREG